MECDASVTFASDVSRVTISETCEVWTAAAASIVDNMGNASSTRHSHEDSVDYGTLHPQGVYSGPQDWNQQIVSQLIIDRRLAPFYRPLEDYDDSWDSDRILAARKDPANPSNPDSPEPSSSISRPSTITKHSKATPPKEVSRSDEAALYQNAVECPICFLVCILKPTNYLLIKPHRPPVLPS